MCISPRRIQKYNPNYYYYKPDAIINVLMTDLILHVYSLIYNWRAYVSDIVNQLLSQRKALIVPLDTICKIPKIHASYKIIINLPYHYTYL